MSRPLLNEIKDACEASVEIGDGIEHRWGAQARAGADAIAQISVLAWGIEQLAQRMESVPLLHSIETIMELSGKLFRQSVEPYVPEKDRDEFAKTVLAMTKRHIIFRED